MLWWGLSLWMLWSSAAEAACDLAFDINRLLVALEEAESALAEGDLERTDRLINDIHDNAVCLPDPIHPRHLVRFGRIRAISAYLLEVDNDVNYWGQLALLDRNVAWPSGIDSEHPGRQVLELMAKRATSTLEGRGFRVPEGGGVLIDGLAAALPTAAPESPHLIQVMEADGRITRTFWQDGTIWPETLLSYDPAPIPPPRRYAAPNPQLDPYAAVVLSQRVAERRAVEQFEAEVALQEAEEDLQRALELQEETTRKRRKRALKKHRRAPPPVDAVPQSDLFAQPLATPSEVPVYVDAPMVERRDLLERARNTKECQDLLRLAPRAMLGRLTQPQLLCLQTRLAVAEKQTTRAEISRQLMADAWAKGDPHRWEASVRRHLEHIDRSDADLCYIFATWLAAQGDEHFEDAIRWARTAQENAHRWTGDRRIARLDALHRIDTMAAMSLWLNAEQDALVSEDADDGRRAGYWRNQTKNLARSWLQFATEARVDTELPFELCLSAAGTVEYCDVG